VLVVDRLSKRYEIYEHPQDRLKQSIAARVQAWLPGSLRRPRQYFKEFWALKNVSLQLARGEALGILGRNGAGKSTLLQIIAGTLAATTGTVTVNGKTAALLELGSGFSPEFTGRENVRLNAALLGLTAQQIDRRFTDIAAFADIGDFIEQPVRTYSSGMLMRLAFAVQTAVEPELLIVDEALSVGDARFQKKCFSRLEQLRQKGTTILFVTHDTGTVVQFCTRALVLDAGAIVAEGTPAIVARQYHQLLFEGEGALAVAAPPRAVDRLAVPDQGQASADKRATEESITSAAAAEEAQRLQAIADGEQSLSRELRYGSREAEIVKIGVRDEERRETRVLEVHRTYEFYFHVRFNVDVKNPVGYGFIITNVRGVELFATKAGLFGLSIAPSKSGYVCECRYRTVVPLVAGTYFLSVAIAHDDDRRANEYLDCRFDALQFQVVGSTRAFTTCVFDMQGVLSHG
jgi:lipopolysaccharide transport system ATP-binding protein